MRCSTVFEVSGRLSLRAASGIIRTVERLGLQPEPLWKLLDARAESLNDPDASVPIELVYALWETCERALARDELAIEVASTGRRPPGDVFAFVTMTSATAGAALENAVRFMHLVSSGARWTVEHTPEHVWLVQQRDDPRRGAALSVEASFAEAVARLREFLVVPELAVDVTFAHAAPRDPRRHVAFFKGHVGFEAPRHTLRIPASLLARPMPKADPSLAAYFETQADRALQKLRRVDSVVEQVRRVLSRDVTGLPSLERVAAELALSERTLRRRLEAEGVGFQALVDEVRASVACQHLAQARLAVSEVAYLLGFSEPSAFHRAFKRWTGQTPSEYRRAQQ